MRGPSPSAIGVLALVASAAEARGDIVVGEGVPFTAAELEDAIAARSGEPAGAIEVEHAAGDELRLVTPDGTWQVAVGDARGSVAARLVALHIVDRDELGALALPPPSIDLDDPDDDAPPLTTVATTAPATQRAWLTFGSGATRGFDGTDLATFIGAIELGGERESWLAAVEASVDTSATSTDAGDVRWVMPRARASLGRRLGEVEILGGVVLGQMFFSNVDDRSSATMVAIGGRARLSLPVGRGRWRVVGGVGADAFHHRIVIRRIGVEEASTPRVSLSASVGLSMELGR